MTEQIRAAPPVLAAVGDLMLHAEGVHVRYRVYDERRRSLRRLVANGFRGGRYREVHAVRGVDLAVRRGEALGVIGRNGSGKSTLLRALAGLVPPSSGVVLTRTMPVLLGIGSVLQGELSCRRNVQIGATALGIARSEARERTEEVLRFAGVEDFADLPFRTLSSGMRARLQFSIATAVQPDILMIDDSLGVGDAEFRAKSEGRMRDDQCAGTVVFVSRSMAQMKRVCTRLVSLKKGASSPTGTRRRWSNATSPRACEEERGLVRLRPAEVAAYRGPATGASTQEALGGTYITHPAGLTSSRGTLRQDERKDPAGSGPRLKIATRSPAPTCRSAAAWSVKGLRRPVPDVSQLRCNAIACPRRLAA